MNKDNLEKFIIEQRNAFDDKEPPKMDWSKVQKAVRKDYKKPGRVTLWKLTQIAAAIIFFISIGVLIGKQSGADSELTDIEQKFPEFFETKNYYESEVNEKLSQLANYTDDPSLQEDMSRQDTFIEELKRALEEAPKGSEERIISAMISNYQTKLEILERVLEASKENNHLKEKSKDDEINM